MCYNAEKIGIYVENIKLKIETISKRIEVAKSKLLIFSAGVAGCWAFLSANYVKFDFLVIISALLMLIFGFGVSVNLTKLQKLDADLEKLQGMLND